MSKAESGGRRICDSRWTDQFQRGTTARKRKSSSTKSHLRVPTTCDIPTLYMRTSALYAYTELFEITKIVVNKASGRQEQHCPHACARGQQTSCLLQQHCLCLQYSRHQRGQHGVVHVLLHCCALCGEQQVQQQQQQQLGDEQELRARSQNKNHTYVVFYKKR